VNEPATRAIEACTPVLQFDLIEKVELCLSRISGAGFAAIYRPESSICFSASLGPRSDRYENATEKDKL